MSKGTTSDTGMGGYLDDFSLQAPVEGPETFDIEGMSQGELLALHGKIEGKLTGLTLEEVNLTRESLLQLQKAKILQAEATKKGTNVPMNQQAQVQNSIASILLTLAKVQMELYTSERHKRIQSAVVRVVKTLPKPQQDQFFTLLEQELKEAEKSMERDPEPLAEAV